MKGVQTKTWGANKACDFALRAFLTSLTCILLSTNFALVFARGSVDYRHLHPTPRLAAYPGACSKDFVRFSRVA